MKNLGAKPQAKPRRARAPKTPSSANHLVQPPATQGGSAVRHVTIDADHHDQRVDNYLIGQLKDVPKSRIYRMVRAGEVRVNKKRVSADDRLISGDVVRIPPVRVSRSPSSGSPTPKPAPPLAAHQLRIVHEDEDLIVIDKPAGLAVHGGSGVDHGVIERLRASRPEAKYLELVHRLDRETSGLLMIAKRRSALVHLHQQLRDRSTEKTYYAIVLGRWPLRAKRLNMPLLKTEDSRGERYVVVSDRGLESSTVVLGLKQIEHELGQISLVRARLETGRTHQIRVHLAASGFPIIGDPKYGDFELNRRFEKSGHRRMFLHACALKFQSRITQTELALQTGFPPSFAALAGSIADPL